MSTTDSQAVRKAVYCNDKGTMTERRFTVEKIQIVKALVCYFYVLWKYF